MFCKNCGMELEDGALFCPACGTKNEPESGETEEQAEVLSADGNAVIPPVEEAEKAEENRVRYCPNCGCENDAEDVFCRECGMALAVVAPVGEHQKPRSAGGGKKLAGMIAAGAACLAVLVLVVWGVTHLVSGTASGSSFVIYDKENELTAARRSKFTPVVVGDEIQEYTDENGNGSGMYEAYYIRYSESGDFLYYPQKCENGEFDLYRKELNKKKDRGTKLVSKILNYSLIDENSFAYIKDSETRKLYLYRKGDSEKIASDVEWFRVSKNGKYILWLADGDLRAQETKFNEAPQKLDSDVTFVWDYSDDLKTIVYQQEEDLYIMRGMKESEKIAGDVDSAYLYDMNGECRIYYLKSDDVDSSAFKGDMAAEEAPAAAAEMPAAPQEDNFDPADYASETLSYYDLITDDLLTQDREITEPMVDDYLTEVFRDGEVDSEWDEQAYDEAYERYEEKLRRDTLRRNLAGSRVDLTQWEVYYYEGGKGESSQVCTVNLTPGMGIYGGMTQTEALLFMGDVTAEQNEPYKLSELCELEYGEAQTRIMERLTESTKLQYLRNGKVSEVAQTEESGVCSYVYANEDQHIAYLQYGEEGRKTVYRYDYTAKDAVPELISDEVGYVVSADMEKLCYVDEDNTLFYGEREVGEEVGSLSVCDDKKVLYLSDQEDNEGTLMLFDGGDNSVEIAENVLANSYGLFDGEHVAYLTDYSFKRYKGDLGVYIGKKGQIIDTDVHRIYFPEKEPDWND